MSSTRYTVKIWFSQWYQRKQKKYNKGKTNIKGRNNCSISDQICSTTCKTGIPTLYDSSRLALALEASITLSLELSSKVL